MKSIHTIYLNKYLQYFIIKSIPYFESTDSNFVLDTAEGWQALGLPSTDDLTSHRNISTKKYEDIYIFTVGVVVSEQIMSVPYQYNRKSQYRRSKYIMILNNPKCPIFGI